MNQDLSFVANYLVTDAAKPFYGKVYEQVQTDFAYYSCKIDGIRFTKRQVQIIFSTGMLPKGMEYVSVYDLLTLNSHFCAMDFVLHTFSEPLSVAYLKKLHQILSHGDSEIQNRGEYRNCNYLHTPYSFASYEEVPASIQELLEEYFSLPSLQLQDLLEFHLRFERIHAFFRQNGFVGRFILFKECLKHGIDPSIITAKVPYYAAIRQSNVSKLLACAQSYVINTDYIEHTKQKKFFSSILGKELREKD